MIGYIILAYSILGIVSSQTLLRTCPYTFPPAAPSPPHCSEICRPFHLGDLLTRNLCYKVSVRETASTATGRYAEIRLYNDDYLGAMGGCFMHKMLEIAIQAVDGEGYPVGQWESAFGNAGFALFAPHYCSINPSNRAYLYLNPDPTMPAPPPEDLPQVDIQKCTESPSLKRRLDNLAMLYGNSKETPTHVRIKHDEAKAVNFPDFTGIGFIWHHDYKVPFNVTFMADVYYKKGSNYIIEASYVGFKTFYTFNPPPPSSPQPSYRSCFDGPSTTIYVPTVPAITPPFIPPPIELAQEYWNEVSGTTVSTTPPLPTTLMPLPMTLMSTPTTVIPTPTPMPMSTTRGVKTPRPPQSPQTLAPIVVVPGRPPPDLNLVPPPPKEENPPVEKDKRKDIFEICELTKKCLASQTEGGRGGENLTEQNICVGDKNCLVILSYGDAEKDEFKVPPDYAYIEMLGRTNSWVALALSVDTEMGDDLVFECVRDRNSGIKMHVSWNIRRRQKGPEQGQPDNIRLDKSYDKENFFIFHDSGFIVDIGNLFCKFSMKKSLFYNNIFENGTRYPFDIETTLYYVLMAVGGTNDDATNKLTRHSPVESWNSQFRIGLGRRFSPTPSQNRLIHAHGQIMYFVFLFLYPNAIFIARYYKETLITQRIFGLRDWHLIHEVLQVSAFIFIFIGHVFLTFANDGWSNPHSVGKNKITFHAWTSLLTASMYLFNILLGIIDHARAFGEPCDLCHWLHAILGHAIYFCGLVALINAESVQYSDLPCNSTQIIGSWIAVYIIFHVIMTFHYCWIDWVVGVAGRAQAIGPIELLVQPQSVEVAPGKYLRLGLLVVFMGISGGFTLTLITLAAIATKQTACYKSEYFIELNKS